MEGMSMMFSPYGDGPLPPTAMAELEKKLKSSKQTKNFLKMLELDKKPKADQVQSAPVSVPASPPPPPPPPPPKPQDTASLQARRAESAFQQQNNQMPSAGRRNVVVPALSLAIPPSPGGQRGLRTQQPDDGDGRGEKETETSADSLQNKHVKFLAPEEGEMSDQSSICQSPSWEGYGQRKKDKKKEAERKKKEKDQAEKEARATKRRTGARLSKSPPPPLPDRKLIVPGLTYADRSMSDPMLISSHLHPNRPTEQRQGDFGRTSSADNLQQLQHHQPDMAEVLSGFNSNGQPFLGGVKLEREREATMHGQYSFPYSQYSGPADSDRSPHTQHSPPPDGSTPAGYPSAKQESRQAFPPSASRTPMLRQMPPPPPRERSNSLLQGATKMFKGRDGKPQGDGDSDRGRHRDGYVHRSREHSTERSLAEIAYDQLVNNGSIQSSSTRSSSRHTQNTRRSSFSQEAKSVAMKLAGMVTGPSSKEDSIRANRASLHKDYFGYMDSKPEAPGVQGTAIFPSRPQDNWRGASADEPVSPYTGELRDVYAAQDRPATSQSSGSSSNPSVAGSVSSGHHKSARRPREPAPPPPNIPTGRLPLSNSSGPAMNGHSESANRIMSKAVTSLRSDHIARAGASIPRPDSATVPLDGHDTTPRATMKPPAKPAKPTAVDTTIGRPSEGSSSSSAYEDGSPVSSPVTTPDTSRPQSSRGVPFTVGEIVKGMSESPGGYDDESTLRQLSDKSSEASTSSTPRLLKSEGNHDAGEEDEVGSGTALPVDTDDAQSFTTSFSNLDNIDNIDGTLASASPSSRVPAEAQEPKFLNLADTLQRPAGFSLRHDSSAQSTLDPPISIPPRSKRRGTGSSHSPSSPDPSPKEERQVLGPEPEEPINEEMQLGLGLVAHHPESEQPHDEETGASKREKAKRRQKQVLSRSPDEALDHEHDLSYGENFPSLGLNSSTFIVPDIPRSPYPSNFPGSSRAPSSMSRASSRAGVSPPSPGLSRFPRASSPPPHPPPLSPGLPGAYRTGPAANTPWRPPSSASTRSSGTNASGSRIANGMPPASILKNPTRATSDPPQPASSAGSRASMLSAIPKHMQVQAGVSTRPPGMTPESRMAPIAKMFVECCGCKFYHDMPSKLYECMAKPDAVVEDRMLGISGAITTMVKCPWCQHNMSTSCCAGYAAVVYLKEKMH